MAERSPSYAAFWPRYLAEHAKPATRLVHFLGTALALLLLLAAIVLAEPWLLLAAVVAGYAFAWAAHLAIERNRPATFTHPFWSLLSDFRMFFLWLAGGLGRELERHGIGRY